MDLVLGRLFWESGAFWADWASGFPFCFATNLQCGNERALRENKNKNQTKPKHHCVCMCVSLKYTGQLIVVWPQRYFCDWNFLIFCHFAQGHKFGSKYNPLALRLRQQFSPCRMWNKLLKKTIRHFPSNGYRTSYKYHLPWLLRIIFIKECIHIIDFSLPNNFFFKQLVVPEQRCLELLGKTRWVPLWHFSKLITGACWKPPCLSQHGTSLWNRRTGTSHFTAFCPLFTPSVRLPLANCFPRLPFYLVNGMG